MIRDLSRKHGLSPFKLVYFYSEVDKEYLRKKIRQNIAMKDSMAEKTNP